jgi:hypothetical protein
MSDEVEDAGDFAVVLSSELIAKVMQEYFVKVMFKQRVRIVDLKPASDGYMFSVAFVKDVKVVPPVDEAGGFMQERVDRYITQSSQEERDKSIERLAQATLVRASNGKFAKKERV